MPLQDAFCIVIPNRIISTEGSVLNNLGCMQIGLRAPLQHLLSQDNITLGDISTRFIIYQTYANVMRLGCKRLQDRTCRDAFRCEQLLKTALQASAISALG